MLSPVYTINDAASADVLRELQRIEHATITTSAARRVARGADARGALTLALDTLWEDAVALFRQEPTVEAELMLCRVALAL